MICSVAVATSGHKFGTVCRGFYSVLFLTVEVNDSLVNHVSNPSHGSSSDEVVI